MRKFIIFVIIILSYLELSSESPKINVQIKEKLQDVNTYSGSALPSREDKIKYGTPFEAKTLVDDATAFINEIGIEKALNEFKEKGGRFHNKVLYIFVFDMDGNVLSHEAEEKLIGKNLIDLKDSAGKYFVKAFIKLIKESPEGWIEYFWRNYNTQKVDLKLTYLKKFNDNIFLGCGAYQPRH